MGTCLSFTAKEKSHHLEISRTSYDQNGGQRSNSDKTAFLVSQQNFGSLIAELGFVINMKVVGLSLSF